MHYADQSDPTENPNFAAFWTDRPDFFRVDDGREERLDDAARRRADALAAEANRTPRAEGVGAEAMTAVKSVAEFDYGSLQGDLADEARRIATRIRSRLREGYLATGHDLIDMKTRLGHGKFGAWLSAEFAMTERSAERYMAAAKLQIAETDIVSDLPAGLVYALAAVSLPPAVRADALSRLRRGEAVTPRDITEAASALKDKQRLQKEEAARSPQARKKREQERLEREARIDADQPLAETARDELVALIITGLADQKPRALTLFKKLKRLGGYWVEEYLKEALEHAVQSEAA